MRYKTTIKQQYSYFRYILLLQFASMVSQMLMFALKNIPRNVNVLRFQFHIILQPFSFEIERSPEIVLDYKSLYQYRLHFLQNNVVSLFKTYCNFIEK